MDFTTGNYSIVSYTKVYGGDSEGEFNGKIISVSNTVSAKRVKDGVTVGDAVPGKGALEQKGDVAVKVENQKKGRGHIRGIIYIKEKIVKFIRQYFIFLIGMGNFSKRFILRNILIVLI